MSDRDEPRTVAGQDWIPTDEEIRDQVTWEFSGEKEATAGAAFDRWLARVKREAAAEAWWEGVNDQWKHRPVGNRVLETDNPHREQVTE